MIKDWKQFASELVSTLEDLLSQRLLFLDDGSLLKVDLNLVDDLSNHESGHYFVLDKSEAWSQA